MTFLSSASEKIYLIMQKNHKTYEKNILLLRYNITKDQMDSLEDYYRDTYGDAANIDDDPEYQMLERYSEQLEDQQEALETSIQALEAQITSEANLIKDGIKGSCGLTLSGG